MEFENELLKWINNNEYIIRDLDFEMFEGAIMKISTDKYERNKEARLKCLEYHGNSCKICGFNFGKFYGSNFEAK